MPLLSFWKSDPRAVLSMNIVQLVGAAGDGQLRDGSECSMELRAFLREVQTEYLRRYADHCLTESFVKSGQVLQDIVNEIGRRLDFEVVNGRYAGVTNAIGNDGLWRSSEGHDLVVEVKTSTAFRIQLDTIAGYRDALRQTEALSRSNSMLVVVGRDDTGELEAQVRGSRHAWDMRLISVDSLFRLLEIKESTEEDETARKIRGVLRPVEYTRLDALVDVLFTTAKDAEDATSDAVEPDDSRTAASGSTWEFTAPSALAVKRAEIIVAVGSHLGQPLIKRTRATYWDSNKTHRAVCTLSKRYTRDNTIPYWYAYHPAWDTFLGDAEEGVFVLGAMDLNRCFVLPHLVFQARLSELNTTENADGSHYWHVKILEQSPGVFALQMPKTGDHLSLQPYVVPTSAAAGI